MKTPPQHVQRVIIEKNLLGENIDKLKVYVNNGCPGESKAESALLKEQLDTMCALHAIYNKRIALYKSCWSEVKIFCDEVASNIEKQDK